MKLIDTTWDWEVLTLGSRLLPSHLAPHERLLTVVCCCCLDDK